MKVRRKLLPGQPGTRKLRELYGEDLVCVGYRYDAQKQIRLKTIEIIIREIAMEENVQEDSCREGRIHSDRVR